MFCSLFFTTPIPVFVILSLPSRKYTHKFTFLTYHFTISPLLLKVEHHFHANSVIYNTGSYIPQKRRNATQQLTKEMNNNMDNNTILTNTLYCVQSNCKTLYIAIQHKINSKITFIYGHLEAFRSIFCYLDSKTRRCLCGNDESAVHYCLCPDCVLKFLISNSQFLIPIKVRARPGFKTHHRLDSKTNEAPKVTMCGGVI